MERKAVWPFGALCSIVHRERRRRFAARDAFGLRVSVVAF